MPYSRSRYSRAYYYKFPCRRYCSLGDSKLPLALSSDYFEILLLSKTLSQVSSNRIYMSQKVSSFFSLCKHIFQSVLLLYKSISVIVARFTEVIVYKLYSRVRSYLTLLYLIKSRISRFLYFNFTTFNLTFRKLSTRFLIVIKRLKYTSFSWILKVSSLARLRIQYLSMKLRLTGLLFNYSLKQFIKQFSILAYYVKVGVSRSLVPIYKLLKIVSISFKPLFAILTTRIRTVTINFKILVRRISYIIVAYFARVLKSNILKLKHSVIASIKRSFEIVYSSIARIYSIFQISYRILLKGVLETVLALYYGLGGRISSLFSISYNIMKQAFSSLKVSFKSLSLKLKYLVFRSNIRISRIAVSSIRYFIKIFSKARFSFQFLLKTLVSRSLSGTYKLFKIAIAYVSYFYSVLSILLKEARLAFRYSLAGFLEIALRSSHNVLRSVANSVTFLFRSLRKLFASVSLVYLQLKMIIKKTNIVYSLRRTVYSIFNTVYNILQPLKEVIRALVIKVSLIYQDVKYYLGVKFTIVPKYLTELIIAIRRIVPKFNVIKYKVSEILKKFIRRRTA